MRLFIAEKPAMGRSIAKNLPGPHSTKDGYIETGGGIVSWCIGHLLETAPPDAYDKKYEKFPGSFDDLPVIPQDWKLQVAGDKGKQVNTIKGLLKRCSEVVNAGDPGREGQLIIDELLDFLGNKKPVLRILLNALDDVSVKRELANLHDNRQFTALYHAGMGRQRADWLVGMNLSRAYTILGSAAGYRGVLSVGRVQSPTLAIVVRRDQEIESFVPQDYWTLKAQFESSLPGKGGKFWATWLPPGSSGGSLDAKSEEDDEEEAADSSSGSRPAWLDKANRIIDQAAANAIVGKVKNAPAMVAEAQRKRVQEQAPLPFDLSAIQIMANAKWNASVQQTLQACQSLYEQGYTTYPRTDCQYLPESQHPDSAEVLSAISRAMPAIASVASQANPSIKSRAWNDAKMGEHHAIIPTRQSPNLASLSDLERKIYETVSQRYLAQFFPPTEADKTKIIMEVEQERFVARGRIMISPGWRIVYGGGDDEPEEAAGEADEEKEDDKASLPPLDQGDAASCLDAVSSAKKTKPPARFTQGTLLDAMKKVHTLVDDPQIKKKLRSVEGIGRSATRAAILETLLKRSFLESKGKQIISTQVGRSLIAALPPKLIDPALTAMWETALDSVATGKASLDAFTAKQIDWLAKLVDAARVQKIDGLPQGSAPSYGGGKSKSASSPKSKSGSKPSAAAKSAAAPAGAKTCPKCKKGKMVKRTAKAGPNAGKEFLGCTNYPECKHAEPIP